MPMIVPLGVRFPACALVLPIIEVMGKTRKAEIVINILDIFIFQSLITYRIQFFALYDALVSSEPIGKIPMYLYWVKWAD
jgi:hypothetical protein